MSSEFSVHRATGLWKDSRWIVRVSPRSFLVSPLFQRLGWWPGSHPSLRRPGRLAVHALCSHPSGACCVPLTLLRERWVSMDSGGGEYVTDRLFWFCRLLNRLFKSSNKMLNCYFSFIGNDLKQICPCGWWLVDEVTFGNHLCRPAVWWRTWLWWHTSLLTWKTGRSSNWPLISGWKT